MSMYKLYLTEQPIYLDLTILFRKYNFEILLDVIRCVRTLLASFSHFKNIEFLIFFSFFFLKVKRTCNLYLECTHIANFHIFPIIAKTSLISEFNICMSKQMLKCFFFWSKYNVGKYEIYFK